MNIQSATYLAIIVCAIGIGIIQSVFSFTLATILGISTGLGLVLIGVVHYGFKKILKDSES